MTGVGEKIQVTTNNRQYDKKDACKSEMPC